LVVFNARNSSDFFVVFLKHYHCGLYTVLRLLPFVLGGLDGGHAAPVGHVRHVGRVLDGLDVAGVVAGLPLGVVGGLPSGFVTANWPVLRLVDLERVVPASAGLVVVVEPLLALVGGPDHVDGLVTGLDVLLLDHVGAVAAWRQCSAVKQAGE